MRWFAQNIILICEFYKILALVADKEKIAVLFVQGEGKQRFTPPCLILAVAYPNFKAYNNIMNFMELCSYQCILHNSRHLFLYSLLVSAQNYGVFTIRFKYTECGILWTILLTSLFSQSRMGALDLTSTWFSFLTIIGGCRNGLLC